MRIIRVYFTKTGEASYISLLDLQRVMQRALKRSGLPVWYTLGFNPHIYMTFASPLSLGQESICETVDFKTEAEACDWGAAAGALSTCLPKGIDVVRIAPAILDANEIADAAYSVRYAAKDAAAARAAWEAYNGASCAEVVKEGKRGKQKTIDLKQHLHAARLVPEDGGLTALLRLPAGNTLNINPVLVLGWLEETQGLPVTAGGILRTGLYTKNGEKFS
ncbi:MAG: DUF2344 domain-containing protein [Subdoligranulum sp.]|nr:DUF2344 domain-containing protein [Subdoligranulum sp.]